MQLVLTPALFAILWTGDIFHIVGYLTRIVSAEKVARVIVHVIRPELTPFVILVIFRIHATYGQGNDQRETLW